MGDDSWLVNVDLTLSTFAVGPGIRAPWVQVIAADGAQLGVLTIADALRIAADAGLDLVEVNPDPVPPICRIVNYERFKDAVHWRGGPGSPGPFSGGESGPAELGIPLGWKRKTDE